jgi:lipopolysaccharide transport system ATP-binding protein
MSETVIQVEHLSKKYVLSHQQTSQYATLREEIADSFRYLGKKLLNSSDKKKTVGDTEEFWALKDVSFEVKQGDRLGIIGRNGSGKSTLLKILSRIIEPTEGEITLDGKITSLLEVGTGFHPELTGRENIFLNGAILGMSRAEIKRKFDEIVAFAEVEKFLDTPVKRYSSGMYVRLAFAVAAHLEPEILIVDEVLAVGDARFQKKCLGKMKDIGEQGRTVLFVSHNMAAIQRLCSKAIYLDLGQIKQVGSSGDVIQAYLSGSSYLDQSVNVLSQSLICSSEVDIISFYPCDEDGNIREYFRISESLCFAIQYRIKKQAPLLRVGIDLYSYLSGDILFRTFDDDFNRYSREPGYFETVCIIPRNLLKPGLYYASLQVGIHNVCWIVDSKIFRQITVEPLIEADRYHSHNRPGVIMPELQWKTIRSR